MNTAIEFFGSIIIALLIFDIIARLNSTYWFRKGFDVGMKVLTDAVVDVTNKMQKK